MKKQNKIVIGTIFAIILLMGIGYAGVTNVNLTINGNVLATADQTNFKVQFTGATPTTESTNPKATVDAKATAGSTQATVDISGLTTKDDSASAILEIENASIDINASSVNVTVGANTEEEYFTVTAVMCKADGEPVTDYAVAHGEKTYVKVTAKLNKTPLEDIGTKISVTVTATPEAAA